MKVCIMCLNLESKHAHPFKEKEPLYLCTHVCE